MSFQSPLIHKINCIYNKTLTKWHAYLHCASVTFACLIYEELSLNLSSMASEKELMSAYWLMQGIYILDPPFLSPKYFCVLFWICHWFFLLLLWIEYLLRVSKFEQQWTLLLKNACTKLKEMCLYMDVQNLHIYDNHSVNLLTSFFVYACNIFWCVNGWT